MAPPGGFFKVVDVVVYISSVANPRKHSRKIQCLESFAEGVRNTGHTVVVEWEYRYTPSKLALMLGWATTNTGGRNIALRKEIIAEQQQRGSQTMCIDASCWKYIDENGSYLRYSLNGPFYDRAEYANHNSDDSKWAEISQQLGVQLKPVKTNTNGHVLICMQRDGGFAMKTLDPVHWVNEKIQQIRSVTDRSIWVRPHPGQYNMSDFQQWTAKKQIKHNVIILEPTQSRLIDNLQGAHSAVFFNSSASVAAVCEGVPVFADDSSCVAWTVANRDISKIESPDTFPREQWIYDLAAAHWSDEDARTGRIYQKFLPYLI
jgi:hypothetical protein